MFPGPDRADPSKDPMAYFHFANGEIRIAGKTFRLPQARSARILLGIGLVVGGLLGFLPILGFWMLPLGFLVLSQDIPLARRWRRRMVVAWSRRRKEKAKGRQ